MLAAMNPSPDESVRPLKSLLAEKSDGHANRRKIKNWVETLALEGERPPQTHASQTPDKAHRHLDPDGVPGTGRLAASDLPTTAEDQQNKQGPPSD